MTLNTFVAGNSGSVRQLAGSMRNLGAGVEDAATGLHRARSDSEADWEGQAGDAFRASADSNARDADRLAQLHTDLATALTGFADDLDTVNTRMEQARQVATNSKLRMLATLIFPPDPAPQPSSIANPSLPGEQHAPDPAAAALQAQQQAAYSEAEATVNQARDLERTAHQKLQDALKANSSALDLIGQRKAWDQAAATATTPAAAGLEKAANSMEDWAATATRAGLEQAVHGGPAAVHGMWMSLTSAQQADLISRSPDLVGNTDGIPASTRSQANIAVLNSRIAASEAAGKPDKRLLALRDALNRPGAPRLLLGFKPEANGGRGQAIITNGDPDTADNVLTNVPGTEADLSGMSGEMDRIDHIADTARHTDPAHTTATISWVDYNAPQFENPLNSPLEGDDAVVAHGNLTQFQNGLQTTHQPGAIAHNTVVGHSYGSTVVGYSARDGGLPNSNLVFLGSPGVGVDNANQLHVGADHVWTAESDMDPITHAIHDLFPGPLDPFAGQEPFGPDPANPSFGGQHLPVNPKDGHSGYYTDPATVQGIANIAVGQEPGS